MRCLTRGEQITYEVLVCKGPQTIVRLAKSTRLYRTSLYQVIENLMNKGLVVKEGSVVKALPPTKLKELVMQEYMKDEMRLLELEKIYSSPLCES
ncbi:hypothetical protein D6774_00655 [Candidatus Woesearchaeota archaeon]|nr:MAG: hypothetical protein D6774_00655 [Candidatus Woesearchaeota archaeon]